MVRCNINLKRSPKVVTQAWQFSDDDTLSGVLQISSTIANTAWSEVTTTHWLHLDLMRSA
jgi:hypothetical protein